MIQNPLVQFSEPPVRIKEFYLPSNLPFWSHRCHRWKWLCKINNFCNADDVKYYFFNFTKLKILYWYIGRDRNERDICEKNGLL